MHGPPPTHKKLQRMPMLALLPLLHHTHAPLGPSSASQAPWGCTAPTRGSGTGNKSWRERKPRETPLGGGVAEMTARKEPRDCNLTFYRWHRTCRLPVEQPSYSITNVLKYSKPGQAIALAMAVVFKPSSTHETLSYDIFCHGTPTLALWATWAVTEQRDLTWPCHTASQPTLPLPLSLCGTPNAPSWNPRAPQNSLKTTKLVQILAQKTKL